MGIFFVCFPCNIRKSCNKILQTKGAFDMRPTLRCLYCILWQHTFTRNSEPIVFWLQLTSWSVCVLTWVFHLFANSCVVQHRVVKYAYQYKLITVYLCMDNVSFGSRSSFSISVNFCAQFNSVWKSDRTVLPDPGWHSSEMFALNISLYFYT